MANDSGQTEIPLSHPMRKMWEEYKASSDYASTRKWAGYDMHVDGSLWAAFVAGWNSRNAHEYTQPGPYNYDHQKPEGGDGR